MAILHITLAAALLALAFAQAQSDEQFQQMLLEKLPGNKLITGPNAQRGMAAVLQAKQFVEQQGCNSRVCFALDAGVFISALEYETQKAFVSLIAAIISFDPVPVFLASVQYGLKRTPITRLTDNFETFITELEATTAPGEWTPARRRNNPDWRRRSRLAFRRALTFCKQELESGGGVNAKKIVFLGDLRSPRGGAAVAKRFLPPVGDGAICAVGFGEGNLAKLQRFTADPNRVLQTDQFFELTDIIVGFVQTVCGPNDPANVNTLFTDSNLA